MADTNTTYDRTNQTTVIEDDEYINEDLRDIPSGDAEKGATLGGVGGAVVGAVAGAAVGPIGAVAGAVIGGLAGGVASGAAVGAIDRHDNDNSVTGLGSTPANNFNDRTYGTPINDTTYIANDTVRYPATTVPTDIRNDYDNAAQEVRKDFDNARYGVSSAANSGLGTGISRETELGEQTSSLKTGGVANDGTPDTRGIGEKFVDGITGDDIDDKTGSVVNHD